MGSSPLAARRSPLAARRSPLAPRPGDLTPPDNSHCARPLSAQIYKYLPPPCSRLSRRSFSRAPALARRASFPLACRPN